MLLPRAMDKPHKQWAILEKSDTETVANVDVMATHARSWECAAWVEHRSLRLEMTGQSMRVMQRAWHDGFVVRLFLGVVDKREPVHRNSNAECSNNEMRQQCKRAGRYRCKGGASARGSKQWGRSTGQAQDVIITIAFIVRRWGFESGDCNGCALPKADRM